MGNTTSEIQLVNSQGQATYTIVMMPEQKNVVAQVQDPSPFGLPQMPNIPYEAYAVGIGMVALALAIWARGKKVGTFTRI